MCPHSSKQNKSSYIVRLLFIFTLLIPLIQTSDFHCKTINEKKECNSCLDGFYLTSDKQCIPCEDPNCKQCLSNSFCLKCFDSFINKKNKCGKICTIQIKNCDLCNDDLSKCIFCNKGCSLDTKTGLCSCNTKSIIRIVCLVISCVIIGIVVFCLINTKMTHNYAIVEGVPVIKLGEEKTDDENLSSRSTKDLNTLRSKISTEVSGKLKNNQKLSDVQSKMGSEINMLTKKEINTKTETYSFENKIKSSILAEKNNSISTTQENYCDYCLIEPIVIQKQCGCKFCDKHKELQEINVKGHVICVICRTEI